MTDLFWGCPSEMLLLVCKRDALDHCSGKPFFLVFCLPIPLIPTSPLLTPACVRKGDRGITGNGEMIDLFWRCSWQMLLLVGKHDALVYCSAEPVFPIFSLPIPLIPTSPLFTPARTQRSLPCFMDGMLKGGTGLACFSSHIFASRMNR